MDKQLSTSTASEVNRLDRELEETLRTALGTGLRIGELLTKQKRNVAHGEWLPWLEANIVFSARTATNYMKLYDNRRRLKSENVSDLNQAYLLLRDKAKPEPEPEKSKEQKRLEEVEDQICIAAKGLYDSSLTIIRLWEDNQATLKEMKEYDTEKFEDVCLAYKDARQNIIDVSPIFTSRGYRSYLQRQEMLTTQNSESES